MKDKPVHLCDNCQHSFVDSDSINGMTYYRDQVCRVKETIVTPYNDEWIVNECEDYTTQ